MSNNIENLDRNFAQSRADDNMDWYDALDVGLEGQGWAREELGRPYDRLPAWAESDVTEPIWELSHCSSGLSVQFATDSDRIAARWTLRSDRIAMPHMPATGVSGLNLYFEDQGVLRSAGVGRPEAQSNEALLISDMAGARRQARIYLPLYNGVESLQIGVARGAKFEPIAPAQDKPIVFWGTSITQGGCASRGGMSYAAILNRRLGRPQVNLGFSGNSNMLDGSAKVLASLKAAAFVIDSLPNMQPDDVRDRTVPFVSALREAHPDTPIVLVESILREYMHWNRSWNTRVCESNRWLKKRYEELLADRIQGLYYLPAAALLGEDNDATVDGSHPSDLGFYRLADAMEPVLRQALSDAP